MTTLCEFAHQFPSVVAMILQQETKLTKGRFREETFTDLLAASLAMLAGPGLQVAYPSEARTGGDLDLCYWHERSGERLTVRIQAKRLSAATASRRSNAWRYRYYKELDHVVPKMGKYQYRTLARKRRSIVPLYAFYNHESVVQNPEVRDLRPIVSGVNLAFATHVRKKLNPHVRPRRTLKFPTWAKRLTEFQPNFFPLADLFCVSSGGIPAPRDIRDNLQRAFASPAGWGAPEDWEGLDVQLDEGDQLAPLGYSRSGDFVSTSSHIHRPTIFLVSGLRDA